MTLGRTPARDGSCGPDRRPAARLASIVKTKAERKEKKMPGIIVGIDGSGHSRRALDWAINEAAIRHAPLTVLTVQQVMRSFWAGPMIYPEDAELAEHARKIAQDETDGALGKLAEDARPPCGYRAGRPRPPSRGNPRRGQGRGHDRRRLPRRGRLQEAADGLGRLPGHPPRPRPRRRHPRRRRADCRERHRERRDEHPRDRRQAGRHVQGDGGQAARAAGQRVPGASTTTTRSSGSSQKPTC